MTGRRRNTNGIILTLPSHETATRRLCELYYRACTSGDFTALDDELKRRVFAAVQPGEILTALAFCGVVTGLAWDLARECRRRKYSPIYFAQAFEAVLREHS